jgi:hypothetical protein
MTRSLAALVALAVFAIAIETSPARTALTQTETVADATAEATSRPVSPSPWSPARAGAAAQAITSTTDSIDTRVERLTTQATARLTTCSQQLMRTIAATGREHKKLDNALKGSQTAVLRVKASVQTPSHGNPTETIEQTAALVSKTKKELEKLTPDERHAVIGQLVHGLLTHARTERN